MREPDDYLDTFSFLSAESKNLLSANGMIVFGFGRGKKSNSLMTEYPNHFMIGFFEGSADEARGYRKLSKYLRKQILK